MYNIVVDTKNISIICQINPLGMMKKSFPNYKNKQAQI